MEDAPSVEMTDTETAAGETPEVEAAGEDAETLTRKDATTEEPTGARPTEDDSRSS